MTLCLRLLSVPELPLQENLSECPQLDCCLSQEIAHHSAYGGEKSCVTQISHSPEILLVAMIPLPLPLHFVFPKEYRFDISGCAIGLTVGSQLWLTGEEQAAIRAIPQTEAWITSGYAQGIMLSMLVALLSAKRQSQLSLSSCNDQLYCAILTV